MTSPSGLVFSPGGNEALLSTVFTRGAEQNVTTQTSKSSPRHLDEKFFTELTNQNIKIPHGERPKTVGQSDDTPRKKQLNRNAIQGNIFFIKFFNKKGVLTL